MQSLNFLLNMKWKLPSFNIVIGEMYEFVCTGFHSKQESRVWV